MSATDTVSATATTKVCLLLLLFPAARHDSGQPVAARGGGVDWRGAPGAVRVLLLHGALHQGRAQHAAMALASAPFDAAEIITVFGAENDEIDKGTSKLLSARRG